MMLGAEMCFRAGILSDAKIFTQAGAFYFHSSTKKDQDCFVYILGNGTKYVSYRILQVSEDTNILAHVCI